MSNLSKPKPPSENPVFFTVVVDGVLKEKLFKVFPDGSFKDVDILYIRIDQVMKKPLSILVNDQEWSVTINEEMGILFVDEFATEEFLDEIFFVMEEYNGIDVKLRTTLSDKEIKDLPAMLDFKIKGEDDGEEFDDRQDKQKQGD